MWGRPSVARLGSVLQHQCTALGETPAALVLSLMVGNGTRSSEGVDPGDVCAAAIRMLAGPARKVAAEWPQSGRKCNSALPPNKDATVDVCQPRLQSSCSVAAELQKMQLCPPAQQRRDHVSFLAPDRRVTAE